MYIEITQDSIGVIELTNKSVDGFFTGGIQTCLIMVFKSENATILVHDSGQLCITNIIDLLSKYGEINSVTVAYGPHFHAKHNYERLHTILSNINLLGTVSKIESNLITFAFIYHLDGKAKCVKDQYSGLIIPIPDKALRMSCIELNNFFLEPDSQKLKPSLQYCNGAYQSEFGLDYNLDEMLEILKRQPDFFFTNLAFLEKAHDLNLLNLPKQLLEVAQRNKVSRFMFKTMNDVDILQQNLEYKGTFKIV
ncbi:MAG: hypothetical protein GY932_03990 [Arcobacter sp.]|nr:hypothetical protein [Arcobacter sp.]